MTRQSVVAPLFTVPAAIALLLAAASAAAAEAPAAHSYTPTTLKWGQAPPALPKGAQAAVLEGDPHQAGPYVVRLKMPPGYTIPPHWHSKAENLTVISGTLSLGMGDTLDRKAAQELPAGGFHAIAAQVHHFAFTRQGAVVQINSEGPFDITYLNPADNPEATPPAPK